MPESVSFVVTTYYKLAKGEHGITQQGTRRIPLATALDWILAEIPDEALDIEIGPRDENGEATSTIRIDWAKIPESVKHPQLPAPRRR